MSNRDELKERYLIAGKIASFEESLKSFQILLEDAKAGNIEEFTAFFNGVVLRLNHDYEKAIESFNNAIDINKNFAYPWNGLGNIYCSYDYEKKNYDKAIVCFKEAIKLDPNFAYPWNNLGNVYRRKKEDDLAIDCFKKAIKLDKNFTHPWTGLGNVYFIKKDYNDSIACFKKSITLDKNYSRPWHGLGNVYCSYDFEKKNYALAIDCYENAIELADTAKDLYFSSTIKERLKIAKEKKAAALPVVETDDLTEIILKETVKEIAGRADLEFKTFTQFTAEKTSEKDSNQIYLTVLRRWNSYTPIITDPYHISKGGGYFLKINGKGFVIDPGFNFIENFKGVRGKHLFHEIDYVFISHAHKDHTNDLESILTLLYEYNEEIKKSSNNDKEDTICKIIAKEKGIEDSDVTDKEIRDRFNESGRKKIIHFYITKSVYTKYSGFFNLSGYFDIDTPKYFTLTVIKNNNHIKFEKIPELYGHVSIKVINASHDDVVSKMDSVGFIFDFKETVLIYTGDTGWTDIMKKQYHEISELYKSKDKILIAHMGGFKEEELEYLDSKDHNKLYYKNHLGRIGITGINETLKPNICLISEFGEEFKEGNSRIEIARIFNKAFNDNGYDITFLPADIGLKYDFIKKQIEVIKKTNFAKKEKTFSYIDAKGVNVLQLDKKDNSLHYYKVKKDSDTIKRYLEDEYDNSLK